MRCFFDPARCAQQLDCGVQSLKYFISFCLLVRACSAAGLTGNWQAATGLAGPRRVTLWTGTGRSRHRIWLNALRHGLTGQAVALPSEDLAAYQKHSGSFQLDDQVGV